MEYLAIGLKLVLSEDFIILLEFCPFYWHFGKENINIKDEGTTGFRIALGPLYFAVIE